MLLLLRNLQAWFAIAATGFSMRYFILPRLVRFTLRDYFEINEEVVSPDSPSHANGVQTLSF